MFHHILDIAAAINAFKLSIHANPEWHKNDKDARRKFLLQLGEVLVKENIVRRFKNKYIQQEIKQLMIQVVPEIKIEQPTINPTATKVQDFSIFFFNSNVFSRCLQKLSVLLKRINSYYKFFKSSNH